MPSAFNYPLEEDPATLASHKGWNQQVYEDLLAMQRGEMDETEFRQRHIWRRAIFVLDMTDFTTAAISAGDLNSLLRILDAQKVCLPILKAHGAELVHCFADDIFALFPEPTAALEAAIGIQRRIREFNASDLASGNPTEVCIGIGFGDLLRIGPDQAQGAEMNKASKLGEDLARARDILLTEQAQEAIGEHPDAVFEHHNPDEVLFGFYETRYE